jgi:non-ribosomal peptide synthase protein (TIGR01720 family)
VDSGAGAGTGWELDLAADLPPGSDPAAPVGYPLGVDAAVVDGELRATWSWPAGVLDPAAVEQLALAWFDHLHGLVAHAREPGAGGHTPSDVTFAGLTQDEIDELEAEWL